MVPNQIVTIYMIALSYDSLRVIKLFSFVELEQKNRIAVL